MLSLVPRPYACARERVWLHKSKSLSPLQNLKASNEIAKRRLLESCGSEELYFRVSQAPSQYYGLVCALCFQDLLQQLEVWFIYTYYTSSRCQAIYFESRIHSRRRTSKHHWRACRSSALCAVSTSNLSNRKVQRIQLLASSIVPTVWRYILWWDSLFNLHSYTYNCRASELPLAQEIGLV